MAKFRSFRDQTLHDFARPHDDIPGRPLKTRAAWTAAQMRAERGSWEQRLDPNQVREIEQALAASRNFVGRLEAMDAGDFPLPTFRHSLASWRAQIGHGCGFVLIRGLPVERWAEADIERAFLGPGPAPRRSRRAKPVWRAARARPRPRGLRGRRVPGAASPVAAVVAVL